METKNRYKDEQGFEYASLNSRGNNEGRDNNEGFEYATADVKGKDNVRVRKYSREWIEQRILEQQKKEMEKMSDKDFEVYYKKLYAEFMPQDNDQQ